MSGYYRKVLADRCIIPHTTVNDVILLQRSIPTT